MNIMKGVAGLERKLAVRSESPESIVEKRLYIDCRIGTYCYYEYIYIYTAVVVLLYATVVLRSQYQVFHLMSLPLSPYPLRTSATSS
jgi:hypothetical protein